MKALTTVDHRSRTRLPHTIVWRCAEGLAWAVGLTAVGFYAVVVIGGAAGRHREMQRFAEAQTAAATVSVASPDQRLWSPERVRAWRDTLTAQAPAPLGILRIPRVGVEVPVLEGTDDWTLNRAVGHIADTVAPGMAGNAGIAGHRDGFFRALKDVQAGDLVEIETLDRVHHYRVERVWIVGPEDVSVLEPSSIPTVTLVTCYPFYFVGPAPQRFIVRAVEAQ